MSTKNEKSSDDCKRDNSSLFLKLHGSKMAAWPEVVTVKNENRYELVLCGGFADPYAVSKRIQQNGLPDDLFSCKSLNFLQVSETCLSEIPPKIEMLTNLTTLVLHSNKLEALCPEVGKLIKLKLLDISNNQILQIPSTLADLESLTTLNASSNKIEKIPDLSHNKWLSAVDFSHNKIDDMSELCHNQFIHLSEIHLKGNKITSIPPSIKDLIALKQLDLSDNCLSEVVYEVGDISKLKEINLLGNPLVDKRLAKVVLQCKSKQILDYVRDHYSKNQSNDAQSKNKKGKNKNKVKQKSMDEEKLASSLSKYKLIVTKSDDLCKVKCTHFTKEVRPYILACVVKKIGWNMEIMKKFIQIQTKMHDGICDKRNFATIATHDLSSCKGRQFTYTALSPDGLKIVPLSRNKEFTGKELFLQLQNEAEALRKEKKRNTYSGIHKFLHLLENKPLYPCLLNTENVVISFPPLTNSELTKISLTTSEIIIEVTSSAAQGNCKKVLDNLLKEMLLNGIGTTEDDENFTLTVEQVRIEEPNGTLIAVYPSRADLVFEDDTIQVIRE